MDLRNGKESFSSIPELGNIPAVVENWFHGLSRHFDQTQMDHRRLVHHFRHYPTTAHHLEETSSTIVPILHQLLTVGPSTDHRVTVQPDSASHHLDHFQLVLGDDVSRHHFTTSRIWSIDLHLVPLYSLAEHVLRSSISNHLVLWFHRHSAPLQRHQLTMAPLFPHPHILRCLLWNPWSRSW